VTTVIEIPSAEEIRRVRNGTECRDLDGLLADLEIISRQVEAAIIETVRHGDETGAWAYDGHRSVAPWLVAASGISRSSANARTRVARFREIGLHVWADAVANAALGIEQARALGRAAANPRVREHLADSESLLLEFAQSMPLAKFLRVLEHWERLADLDGALSNDEVTDRNRTFKMGFVGSEFHFKGQCGAAQGAVIAQLLQQFIDAEYRADLRAAADGDLSEANSAALSRTPGQRRLDALVTALEHAASSDRNTVEPVVNLVCDTTTLMEWLRYGIGGAHPVPDPSSIAIRRCDAMGEAPIDPRVMLEAALSGRVRTVVTAGDGSVQSIARPTRFFDRNTRDAIRSIDAGCYWPGCTAPAHACDIDHLMPHSRGGKTNPENAGAACRRHNLMKSDRWYASRRRGGWSIQRPDGSMLSDAPPMGPAGLG
jgi:hypothetical protein